VPVHFYFPLSPTFSPGEVPIADDVKASCHESGVIIFFLARAGTNCHPHNNFFSLLSVPCGESSHLKLVVGQQVCASRRSKKTAVSSGFLSHARTICRTSKIVAKTMAVDFFEVCQL
jgi:hypothetical protein